MHSPSRPVLCPAVSFSVVIRTQLAPLPAATLPLVHVFMPAVFDLPQRHDTKFYFATVEVTTKADAQRFVTGEEETGEKGRVTKKKALGEFTRMAKSQQGVAQTMKF